MEPFFGNMREAENAFDAFFCVNLAAFAHTLCFPQGRFFQRQGEII